MRYRIKTKEEVINDGGWDNKNNKPYNWNLEGEMNYLLGYKLPEYYKGGDYKDYSRGNGNFWLVEKRHIVPLEEESLLDKAKRLYPVGTKFIPAHIENYQLTIIEEGVFKTIGDSIYHLVEGRKLLTGRSPLFEVAGGNEFHRLIYHEGKWAEIVPEPIEKENTEFEAVETGNNSHLIKKSETIKIEQNEKSRREEQIDGIMDSMLRSKRCNSVKSRASKIQSIIEEDYCED